MQYVLTVKSSMREDFWKDVNKSLAKNPITCKGRGVEHVLFDHIIYTPMATPTHRIKQCRNCWRTIESYDYYTKERIF